MLLCEQLFWRLLMLSSIVGTVQGILCGVCEQSHCPPAPAHCPGGIVPDPCDCCLGCARVENETCGGQYGLLGSCDHHLTCVISPLPGRPITGHEIGVCQPIKDEPVASMLCDRCEVIEEANCPNDSQVVYHEKGAGQCCPPPPTCHCKPCPEDLCPLGQVPVTSDQNPGSCCDLLDCVPLEDYCANVTCERISGAPGDDEDLTEDSSGDLDPQPRSCPSDSEPLPPLLTNNGCCHHAGCRCRENLECTVPDCPQYQQLELKEAGQATPGKCCDIFTCVDRECRRGNETRAHGEKWFIDNCTFCECNQGLTVCSLVDCPAPPSGCSLLAFPEDGCCPICPGMCVSEDGEIRENWSVWHPDDCTTCQCQDGQVTCQMTSCSVPCSHPRKIPGHCCPECDDVRSFTLAPHCPLLENCTLLCPHGYNRDERGCYQCQCKLFECDLGCPEGYQYSIEGHKLCECKGTLPPPTCPSIENCQKNCVYGFKKNKQGCPRCRCNKCPDFHCKKKCSNGYVYNNKGCKLCRCMDPNDTISTTMSTSPVPWTQGPGCMSMKGLMMDEGESWFDGCRRCFCLNGHEMCALITCPVPQCHNIVFKTGDCCPKCAGDAKTVIPGMTKMCEGENGVQYLEGETWRLNECTLCICHDNGVLCEVETCPPVLCHHPIQLSGICCPICSDDSQVIPVPPVKIKRGCKTDSGSHFMDGDSWRVNPCQSCVCQHGQIHCFSQTCPLLTCNKTIFRKGQCCPYCLDSQGKIAIKTNITIPEYKDKDTEPSRVTVIVLGIMVVLLLFLVFLLVLLLLRTRRKIFRIQDSIPRRHLDDGALYSVKDGNLRPKSTNVELQGTSPLPAEALKLLHWTDDPYSHAWKQDNLENEALQEVKLAMATPPPPPRWDTGTAVQDKVELDDMSDEKDDKEGEEQDEDDEEKKVPLSSDEDSASSQECVSSRGSCEKDLDKLSQEDIAPMSLEDRLQYNDLNFLLSNDKAVQELTDSGKLLGKDPLVNLFLYMPSDVDPNNFRKSV